MVLFGDVKPGQVFKVEGETTLKAEYWIRANEQEGLRVWKDGGVWKVCRPLQRRCFVHNGPGISNPEVKVVGQCSPEEVRASIAA